MKILGQVCSVCYRHLRRLPSSCELRPRASPMVKHHSTVNQAAKIFYIRNAVKLSSNSLNLPGVQTSCLLNSVRNDGTGEFIRRGYSSFTHNPTQRRVANCVLAVRKGTEHPHLPMLLPMGGTPFVRSEGTTASGGVIGYLPTPVELTYEYLEYLHDDICLPWWLVIIAVTTIYKGIAVLPMGVLQQRVFARIENAQPEINTLVERYRQQLAITAGEEGLSKAQHQREFDKGVKVLVRSIHLKQRCSSSRLSYVVIAQLSVWATITAALGQMSGWYPEFFLSEPDIDILPTLATEGVLWFTNLLQSDLAIPIMLGLVNLTLVELWSLRKGPLSRMQQRFQNPARLAALGSIPVATLMPSAISFYWLISSVFGLAQYAVLRVPVMRKYLGIPRAPSDMRHPLTEIKTGLKIKYWGKKVF